MIFLARLLVFGVAIVVSVWPAAAQDLPDLPPAPCGGKPIAIARMPWPSAELLAEIHAQLIKQNFGCETEVVGGDPATTATAMGAQGVPTVVPELWIGHIAEIWNTALQGQNVRDAGATYAETHLEGWFIPKALAEASPDLLAIEGIKARPAAFKSGGKGARFISCPPEWACSLLSRNLLEAHGLTAHFDIVEPANRYELDRLITEAVALRQPVLFYYWRPNPLLAQLGFRAVDLGAFDQTRFTCLGQRACPAPAPSNFAAEPVIIALAQWVYFEAPAIAAYFSRARMPLAEMDALLLEAGQPGTKLEAIAEKFVATRRDLWGQWVASDVP